MSKPLLDMSILKPGTDMCLICGHLSPPGSKYTDHYIEEAVFFADGCRSVNSRCPTRDGWIRDRSDYQAEHGHVLPEHWVAADGPWRTRTPESLIAEHLAHHQAEGTLTSHLADVGAV